MGKEKVRPSGTYRTEEVNKALGLMFAHKCYLCEQKGLSDLQIEHLIPHRQNRDLMFDWNNLFLSCAHCNNIKNDKYTPILDCTRTDVDKKIAFHRYRELFEEDRLDIVALDDSLLKCTPPAPNIPSSPILPSRPRKCSPPPRRCARWGAGRRWSWR